MGDGALWRIPERKKVEAVFFDVDGTLTDAQGRIPDRTVSVLEYMAKRLPLYLSTALPVSHAKNGLAMCSACSRAEFCGRRSVMLRGNYRMCSDCKSYDCRFSGLQGDPLYPGGESL